MVKESKFHVSRVLGYRWPKGAPRHFLRTKTGAGAALALAGGTATVVANVANVVPPSDPTPAAPSVIQQGADIVEATKPALEQVATVTHGSPVYKYVMIAISVVTIAGAALAIYGRMDTRKRTGE